MSCEVINPTAALPELGADETHLHTTGGASLANDDVMRGGGAAEIGMWRKQVR